MEKSLVLRNCKIKQGLSVMIIFIKLNKYFMRYNFLLKLKNKPNRFQKPVRFESSMKIIVQIFILLVFFNCKQEVTLKKENVKIKNTDFEFKQPRFSDIQRIEKLNGGIKYVRNIDIRLSNSYFPDIEKYEFAQPIIYHRDTANLDTQISYFFTKKDSIVRLIEYSWNQDKKKKPFIDNLYKLNKKNISDELKMKGLEKNEKVDYWWQKIIRWDNTSMHIYSFIFGMEEGERTRVIVRFK